MSRRPRVAVIANPNGGIGLCVQHFWAPLSRFAELQWVAPRDERHGEIVAAAGLPIASILDRDRPTSVARIAARLAAGADIVNLQLATSAVAHLDFHRCLLEACRREGLRIVLSVHNVRPFSVSRYDPAALRELYELGDGFLVGNPAEAQELRATLDVGQRPIAVARLGPFVLLDSGRSDHGSARDRLGLPAAAPVALFFGSFREEKGLEALVAAFPLVQSVYPQACLYVSTSLRFNPGGRPGLAAVHAAARSRSGWLIREEFIPDREIELLFRAADVVALPYRRVTQSGVRCVAAAFARPVVVTEAFEDGADLDPMWGRCVPIDDPPALAAALVDLFARSTAERDAMGQAGFDRAARYENWDQYAERAAGLFQSVLAGGVAAAH